MEGIADLSCTEVNLHPQAKDLLFEHYRTLLRIFREVLGHLEIDYMAIALLSRHNELLFFSSHPSIEYNLIEQNIWQLDASFHPDFFLAGKARLWEDLYHKNGQGSLHHIKQESPKFPIGIAVPSRFEQYQVVYSFASKSNDETVKNNLVNKIDTLGNIGKFCLQKILQTISLPTQPKPVLKLVVNKK